VAGQEAGAVAQNGIVIDFPSNGAQITPTAARELDVAARLFHEVGPAAIFVTGYADPTGDQFANLICPHSAPRQSSWRSLHVAFRRIVCPPGRSVSLRWPTPRRQWDRRIAGSSSLGACCSVDCRSAISMRRERRTG
jgi:hypothetical protein